MHAHFCIFGVHLCAQSVLIDKISAWELRRKFIECVVGWVRVERVFFFFLVWLPSTNWLRQGVFAQLSRFARQKTVVAGLVTLSKEDGDEDSHGGSTGIASVVQGEISNRIFYWKDAASFTSSKDCPGKCLLNGVFFLTT